MPEHYRQKATDLTLNIVHRHAGHTAQMESLPDCSRIQTNARTSKKKNL
jgi:hypothetical protein